MFDARMVDDDHADSAPVLPFQTSSCAIILACKRMFRSTMSAKTNNADPEVSPRIAIVIQEVSE
jgi:hypothetical protein